MQKSRIFGSLTLSKLFIVLCAIFTFSINNASAATCSTTAGVCASWVSNLDYTTTNCNTTTTKCVSNGTNFVQITYCASCKSGYTLSTISATINGCDSTTYNVCQYDSGDSTVTSCTSNSDCPSLSGGEFTTVATGYRAKYGKGICNTSTKKCRYGYYYQCDEGYYKTSLLTAVSCTDIINVSTGAIGFNNCAGCSRCAEFTGDGDSSNAYYGTSAAGSTMASNCYIPADEEFSDTTGTWSFSDDCHTGLTLN